MKKVFIDGQAGTTGLKLKEYLERRSDIELLIIPEEKRKDISVRKEYINSSDATFLCLPDAEAVAAVSLVENPCTRIIDASTAHRTDANWAYGFPELDESHKNAIIGGARVAVPGCHASGFVSLIYPLIKSGVMKKDYPVSAFSITGYSGGGKKMIAEYENEGRSVFLNSPRQYGITQEHKHLKEIKYVCGLNNAPLFSPIVADFYSGMEVSVPLYTNMLGGISKKEVQQLFCEWYKDKPLVSVMSEEDVEKYGGYIPANALSGTNEMKIMVLGNDERILLVSLFDNLGKGASGAAVENFNIMFGLKATEGLI